MTKQDWVLLAAEAGRGKPLSPIQLQKALFLLAHELPNDITSDFYTFKPYNYGPFDATIYSDAELLSLQGLIKIENQPGRSWSSYTLTPEGLEHVKNVRAEVSPRALAYLGSIVEWMQRVGFQQMLRAVYKKYPDYAVNSVFKG